MNIYNGPKQNFRRHGSLESSLLRKIINKSSQSRRKLSFSLYQNHQVFSLSLSLDPQAKVTDYKYLYMCNLFVTKMCVRQIEIGATMSMWSILRRKLATQPSSSSSSAFVCSKFSFLTQISKLFLKFVVRFIYLFIGFWTLNLNAWLLHYQSERGSLNQYSMCVSVFYFL